MLASALISKTVPFREVPIYGFAIVTTDAGKRIKIQKILSIEAHYVAPNRVEEHSIGGRNGRGHPLKGRPFNALFQCKAGHAYFTLPDELEVEYLPEHI